MTHATPHSPTGPALRVRGLELHTSRGSVYPPTTFDASAGAVTALCGPARSGRSALLLTLAGRMRPSAGSARVAGHDAVREVGAVRRAVGLGIVAGVNDLDDALSAGQHLRERALFARSTLDPSAALAVVGLEGQRDTRAGDLDTDGIMRLGIALALIGDPSVIAIDDLDHDLDLAEQTAIARLLRDLAHERGLTVLYTCVDERTAALADAVVRLPEHAERQEVTDEVA